MGAVHLQKLQYARHKGNQPDGSPVDRIRDAQQRNQAMIDIDSDGSFENNMRPIAPGSLTRKKCNTHNGFSLNGRGAHTPDSVYAHASSQRLPKKEQDDRRFGVPARRSLFGGEISVDTMFPHGPFRSHTGVQKTRRSHDRDHGSDRERAPAPSTVETSEHVRHAATLSSMHSHRIGLSLGSSALGMPKSKGTTDNKSNDAVSQHVTDGGNMKCEQGFPGVPTLLPMSMDAVGDGVGGEQQG